MMSFWILYGIISLFFSPYSVAKEALKDILSLLLGICSVYCIYSKISSDQEIRQLIKYVKIICVGLIVFAFFESALALHLPTSKLYPASGYSEDAALLLKNSFSSTLDTSTTLFFGINDFSAFISSFLPLFFYSNKRTKKSNILHFIILILGILLLTSNDANISLIAVFLSLVLFSILQFKALRVNIMITLSLFLTHFWLYKVVKKLLLLLKNKIYQLVFCPLTSKVNPTLAEVYVTGAEISNVNISKVISTQFQNAVTNSRGSLYNRFMLYLDSLEISLKTYGLGLGPAAFESYFKNNPHRSNLINPHNWWLEVLSQYGIFVFLFYLGTLLYLFINMLKRFFKTFDSDIAIMCAVCVSFVISCIAPSSFLGSGYQWMIPAFVIVMLSKDLKKNKQ